MQPSAMGITCKGVATMHRVECCDYAAHLKSGLQVSLAVHRDDKVMCEQTGHVPRRVYAGPHKTYIGLRARLEDAVKRAEQFFGKNCAVSRHSLLILRVQFTALGFAKYATMLSGSESNFAPMLHKIVYEYDKSDMDWGVWYFHGDLPLRDSAAHGEVLITSEWMEIF